jgi:hypothetical protein
MKTTRSRIFTLVCVVAMLAGLACAAWAHVSVDRELDRADPFGLVA